MNNLYEMYTNDEALEQVGQWVNFGVCELRIARAGGSNKKYIKVHQELMKPYEQRARIGALDDETAWPVLAKIYAKAVVLDWKNVTDRNGEALAYTEANVVTLLQDLPDLFSDIIAIATNDQAWKAQVLEEQAKNSPAA